MSWSGFKKAVNRAGAHVIMKTTNSKNELSVDSEFEDKENKFTIFENLINELNSELSNFKDILTDLINTQFKLIQTFDSFYGNYNFTLNSDNLIGQLDVTNNNNENDNNSNSNNVNLRDGISLQLLKNLNDIKNNILPEIINPIDITVFKPINELNDYNLEIHKLIKKRGRKKFDYDISKSKLDKLQNDYNNLEFQINNNSNFNSASNSNGNSISDSANINQLDKLGDKLNKFKTEFNTVSSIYNDINQRLKSEIDEYITLRFSLLDPSFESFIKIQLKLFTDLQQNFEKDIQIDSITKYDYQSGKLDNTLDDILNKMKALDIHNL